MNNSKWFSFSAFLNAIALRSHFNDDISCWDVSNVKDMKDMFHGAEMFNKSISRWDVSSVEDMSGMFCRAFRFDKDCVKSWTKKEGCKQTFGEKVSGNGRQLIYPGVFAANTLLREKIELKQAVAEWQSPIKRPAIEAYYGHISGWDTSEVTDMSRLFEGMPDFNEDISTWNVGKVKDMSMMFIGGGRPHPFIRLSFEGVCLDRRLSSILRPLALPETVFGIGRFSRPSKFNQPIGSWNVASCEKMNFMFFWAGNINQDLSSWQVREGVEMTWMFRGAFKLSSFDDSNWTTKPMSPKAERKIDVTWVVTLLIAYFASLSFFLVPNAPALSSSFQANPFYWPAWVFCGSYCAFVSTYLISWTLMAIVRLLFGQF